MGLGRLAIKGKSMILSIIINAFDARAGLEKTLASIVDGQRPFVDDEVIVLSPGVATERLRGCEAYGGANFVFVSSASPTEAMKAAVFQAKGVYLLFLNSGDRLSPGVLSQVFDSVKGRDILLGGVDFVDEAGSVKKVGFSSVRPIRSWTFLLCPPLQQGVFISRSLMNEYPELPLGGWKRERFFFDLLMVRQTPIRRIPLSVGKITESEGDPPRHSLRVGLIFRLSFFLPYAGRVLASLAKRGAGWLIASPRVWERQLSLRLFHRPKRVLLLKTHLDRIGDVVLMTGTLAHFRKAFPDAVLELAVPSACLPIFKNHPDITRALPIEAFMRADQVPRMRNAGREDVVILLRHRPVPTEVDLAQSFRAGQVVRVPELYRPRACLDLPEVESTFEIAGLVGLLRKIGLPHLTAADIKPTIPEDYPDFSRINEALCTLPSKACVPLYGCVPSASNPLRNWSPQKYHEVFTALAPCHVVLLGTSEEREFSESLHLDAIPGVCVVNLVGRTTLPQFFGAIKRTGLVITAETSAVHIARAMGKKAVCLAGGGHWNWFVPYHDAPFVKTLTATTDCFGCDWICTKSKQSCILDITSEAVVAAVHELLLLPDEIKG